MRVLELVRIGPRIVTSLIMLVLAAAMAPTAPAHAAKLYLLDFETPNYPSKLFFEPVCNAKLKGVIRGPRMEGGVAVPGDSEAIAAALGVFQGQHAEAAKGRLYYDGRFFALCLSSIGGDLREALKIAGLFRGWMTVVENGELCVSACAVLFMSAKPRDRVHAFSAGNPGRFLHHAGRLGFHAPRLVFPESEARDFTPKQAAQRAETAYADALARLRQVAFPAVDDYTAGDAGGAPAGGKVADTFIYRSADPESVAMPAELLLAFLTVPPEQVYFITRLEEALSWGIEIFGVKAPAVLTASMLASACINVAAQRCAQSPDNECVRRPGELEKPLGLLKLLQEELERESSACLGKPEPDCAPEGIRGRRIAGLRTKLEAIIKGTDSRYENLGLTFGVTAFSQSLKAGFGEAGLAPHIGTEYGFKKHTLTGKPITYAVNSIYVIQAFEMATQNGVPVCDIRALWARDFLEKSFERYELRELKIDTSAGSLDSRRPLLQQLDETSGVADLTLASGQSSRYALRPWRMLPAGTRLEDLAGPDPWGWLDEGPDFFDRPPGW